MGEYMAPLTRSQKFEKLCTLEAWIEDSRKRMDEIQETLAKHETERALLLEDLAMKYTEESEVS